jgi:hypothetical protein
MDYTCPNKLTLNNLREYLSDLLLKYQEGLYEMNDMINYAESVEEYLWEKYSDLENSSFPGDENLSIPLEVIHYMYGFTKNFGMIPQDVPHFIEFLDTPIGKEKEGWEKFIKYISGLKLEERIPEEEKQGFFRSVAALNAKNKNE